MILKEEFDNELMTTFDEKEENNLQIPNEIEILSPLFVTRDEQIDKNIEKLTDISIEKEVIESTEVTEVTEETMSEDTITNEITDQDTPILDSVNSIECTTDENEEIKDDESDTNETQKLLNSFPICGICTCIIS